MKLFTAGATLLLILLPLMAEEMNLVKLHIESFSVVGLQIRTSNTQAANDGSIGKLWGRMAAESLLDRIKHRVDTNVIAVYSGYESDRDGLYTYTLGAKVSSGHDIPEEMAAVKIAAGDYAMFTAQGGPPPQMTVDLWKHIWSLEKPGPVHRAYKTDFEVHYNGLKAGPPNTHIDVYIGVVK